MKILLKRFYKNLRSRLSSSNSFLFIGYYKYLYRPKEGSLSFLISEYSNKNKNFTVIQVGANDGITHDPIHKFIKRDNWKGVLLEPQKHLFPGLCKLYRKNRGITILNAAVGYEDGSTNIYKIGFSDARWATGLATFNKEVLQDAFNSGYVLRNAEKDNITIPENPEEQIIAEKIQVLSPANLLKTYSIDHINLLQIDTEGFDFEIIKMFLDTNITPGMIIFENTHLSENDLADCQKLLLARGYQTEKHGRNTAAIRITISPPGNS
jgi:FkbM family methyltransferase